MAKAEPPSGLGRQKPPLFKGYDVAENLPRFIFKTFGNLMNPSFDQFIVGSWELVSTTQNNMEPHWVIDHYSKDGFHSIDTSLVNEFCYPGRYKVEGDDLIFIWSSWGGEDTHSKVSLDETGNMKIVDHRGYNYTYRRLEDLRPETHAYIDDQGKLRRKPAERKGAGSGLSAPAITRPGQLGASEG